MNWFTKSTVVAPVDFSAESIAAVDVALDAVADPQGLHILHVLPVQIQLGSESRTISQRGGRENAS